jgi:hypothetical protein
VTVTRIVIVGGPKAGKTTFSARFPLPVIHTDEFRSLGSFSAQSAAVAALFNAPGPWLIEGVTTVRALRKWLRSHPEGKPCDLVYALWTPFEPLSPGQRSLLAGCRKVWAEVEDPLLARGVIVPILHFDPKLA